MSEVKRDKVIRTETGRVISDKMDQTITVLVERKVKHPIYKKYVKKSTKLKAHDAENKCAEGDVVRIQESRPRSKTKTWELLEIVEKTN